MFKKIVSMFVLLMMAVGSVWGLKYDFSNYAYNYNPGLSPGAVVSMVSSGTTKVYNGRTCTIYSNITDGNGSGFEMSRFAMEDEIMIRRSNGSTYGLMNTNHNVSKYFAIRNIYKGQKIKIHYESGKNVTYFNYGDASLINVSNETVLQSEQEYEIGTSGDLVLMLDGGIWVYSITIEDGIVFDFTLSSPYYRSDGSNNALTSATKDDITLTFNSGATSGLVTTEKKEDDTHIYALKFQPSTSFTLTAPNNKLITKVLIMCRENTRDWSLIGDGSISRDGYVTTWTGKTNGSLVFTNNNTKNLNVSAICVIYEDITETVGTYVISSSNASVAFTGAGALYRKTFNLNGCILQLGNVNDENKGKAQIVSLDNNKFGVHLVDGNGFDFGNPYTDDGWGTFYTIKTKADGHLFVYVQGKPDIIISDTNGSPLYLMEGSNIRKQIAYSQFKDGVTTLDLGYLYKDKTYILYCGYPACLYLQKFEYFTEQNKLLEYEDYDEYAVGSDTEYVWTANNDLRAVVATDNDTYGSFAKIAPADGDSHSVLYEFSGIDTQTSYSVVFHAAITPGNTDGSQIALYRTKPGTNETASDYLFAVNVDKDNNYSVWVNGSKIEDITSGNAVSGHWLRYEINVDNGNQLTYKITNLNNGLTVSNSHAGNQNHPAVPLSDGCKALGISYFAGKANSVGKFDNILVTSSQQPMGNVTAPTIEISGILGESRKVKVTSGVSEEGRKVTTYYEYTNVVLTNETGLIPQKDDKGNTVLDENGNIVYVEGYLPYDWNYILTNASWENWSNPGPFNTDVKSFEEFTLGPNQPGERLVYFVRAISTIEDYVTVLSDTAYLAVAVGEKYQLTGGFAVQNMVKVEYTLSNNTPKQEAYYTPVVRAYVDTRFIPEDDISKLQIRLQYEPLDYKYEYGNDNKPDFEYLLGGKSGNTLTSVDITDDAIKHSDGYYFEFTVPRSATYQIHISGGDDYTPATINKIYYRNKYKVTYYTPNFSESNNPVSDFMDINDSYSIAQNNGDIYGYTPWSNWTGATLSNQLKDWNNDGAHDFYWNTYTKGTTATLNSISSAKSGASTQTYNIRTTQYDDSNPIFLRKGWGIVKDSDTPWSYSCALAHIGMGNEIPEFTIDDGMGRAHHQYKVYPNPFITGKNTPECIVTVPSRAALVQYKVYTPVETKTVSATSGLASFSSYYSLYHVADYFIENDELVGSYFAPNHYSFGSNYLLNMCWYMKEREGYLLAANIYNGKDIWEGYDIYKNENNRWAENKTIELRIIDATPDYAWRDKSQNAFNNRIKPVLLDNEVQLLKNAEEGNAGNDFIYIYASDIVEDYKANENGHAQMVLLKGKRNEKDCYNFFCLPKVTSKAKMVNKTSYILREDKYSDYLRSQQTSTVKEEGERFIFGMIDDGEVVGIDLVEDNANVMNYDNGVFYNIAGQKVSTPTKGIYIVNGKKVLVK